MGRCEEGLRVLLGCVAGLGVVFVAIPQLAKVVFVLMLQGAHGLQRGLLRCGAALYFTLLEESGLDQLVESEPGAFGTLD